MLGLLHFIACLEPPMTSIRDDVVIVFLYAAPLTVHRMTALSSPPVVTSLYSENNIIGRRLHLAIDILPCIPSNAKSWELSNKNKINI